MYVSADASARVIWRDAGRAVNGGGTASERAAIHDRMCGRQAPPWHVPTPARLARLRSSSSLNPRSQAPWRSSTVVPEQGQTTPSVGGGGRSWSLAAGPTARTRRLAGHPGEQVARRATEAQDDGVARGRDLRARVVRGDDGTDAHVALEPDEAARNGRARHARRRCPDGDGHAEIDTGPVESLRGARGQQARRAGCPDRPDGSPPRRSRRRPRRARTCSIPVGVRATTVGPA